MDNDNNQKTDMKVPEGEVGDKINAMWEAEEVIIVTVLSACGQEMVIDAKEATS